MLMALTELDVTDCTRLTDRAVAAVSTRCPHMAVLRLSGCSNLTDKSLQYLLHEPRHNKPRGQDLVRVDLAFCIQLTNEGIEAMCQACEKLEALDLSGCVHLTDEVIAAVAKYCPHLQRLSLARCKRLTDRTLCTLADYLWIEELDVSHCNKVRGGSRREMVLELPTVWSRSPPTQRPARTCLGRRQCRYWSPVRLSPPSSPGVVTRVTGHGRGHRGGGRRVPGAQEAEHGVVLPPDRALAPRARTQLRRAAGAQRGRVLRHTPHGGR